MPQSTRPNIRGETVSEIQAQSFSGVQGDLYEYLLSKLNTAGRNGQFRTPRHIIRMMVQMIDPKATERICDPAAGTCGFLVNAYQYILEQNTSPDVLQYDTEGMPHNLTGDLMDEKSEEFLQADAISGFDSDSGMTMLRIGSMNLMLHGLSHPNFRYADTLSKSYTEERRYNVVLANPPFKGAIDTPLPLQEKFAAIVQKFERIRRQQREATRQAEHLFQTLLHRAFRGELE